MIWITSDLHFNHNKEFIYKARGFENISQMNEAIIENINDRVTYEDDLWILGDLCLGPDIEGNKQLIERINCPNIRIIYGNHDTDTRKAMYDTCWNVIGGRYAYQQKWNGYHFYLSHFPTITSNLEKESLRQCTCCLYGHTHQISNFYLEYPMIYHVGVDSHNLCPVSINEIIYDMKIKAKECKDLL